MLDPPAGCAPLAPTRTRCDLGVLPAGRTQTLRFTVAATPDAQREAPLAGALTGWLDPESGPARQVQMSFRITAAAALSTPPAGVPAPTGSQGLIAAQGGTVALSGMSSAQRTALALITVSVLLVVLALVLATGALRRRSAEVAGTHRLAGRPDLPAVGAGGGGRPDGRGDIDYGVHDKTPHSRTDFADPVPRCRTSTKDALSPGRRLGGER